MSKGQRGIGSLKENLTQYVIELDGQLTTIQEKIQELKKKIEEKQAELTQTEEELRLAIEDQENQYLCYERKNQVYV